MFRMKSISGWTTKMPLFLAALGLLMPILWNENVLGRNPDTQSITPSIPFSFCANAGQFPEAVRFRAMQGNVTYWFTDDAIYHDIINPNVMNGEAQQLDAGHPGRQVIKVEFVGCRKQTIIEGLTPTSFSSGFFLGNDKSKWREKVASYEEILYHDLYPGIDLRFYQSHGNLKYDFIVREGANPSQIRLQYTGQKSLQLTNDGKVSVTSLLGTLEEATPYIYQSLNEQTVAIEGQYKLTDKEIVSFTIGNYDKSKPLTIDPAITWNTYLGGTGRDRAIKTTADLNHNIFVVGLTFSSDFPVTANGYDTSHNTNMDVFLTEISHDTVIYSSYFGGNGDDSVRAIDFSDYSTNFVCFAGRTTSSDYPTTSGAYDQSGNGVDGFVTKFSLTFNSISSGDAFSTYLGGSSATDEIFDEVMDANGYVYVTGRTFINTGSSDFPDVNAFQPSEGGSNDAFISKITPDGDSLVYSTFFGGSGSDWGYGITLVDGDKPYICGRSTSDSLYGELNSGGEDGFEAELSNDGQNLVYVSQTGGSSDDQYNAVVVKKIGSHQHFFLVGQTESSDFPVSASAYDTSYNGGIDAVYNYDGTQTFLGGSGDDIAYDVAWDEVAGSGNPNIGFVIGSTTSTGFPTLNATDTSHNGNLDVFVARFIEDSLVNSTFLGGSGDDVGQGINRLSTGMASIAGWTSSSNLPVPNPYDASYNGSIDAFTGKYDFIGCCTGVRGNVDNDGSDALNVTDLNYLIAYFYSGGPAPVCPEEADVNGSGSINVLDLNYLVAYFFASGPAPIDCQ